MRSLDEIGSLPASLLARLQQKIRSVEFLTTLIPMTSRL